MNQRVVAVFDDRRQAELAREELYDVGFNRGDVNLTFGSSETTAAGAEEAAEEPSVWDRIKEFFGAEDYSAYDEASRRGHIILVATVPEKKVDQVADILQRHHPIDLDKHTAEWRKSGWQGYGATTGTTGTTGYGTTATTGQTVPPQQPVGKTTPGQQPVTARGGIEEQKVPIVEEQLSVGKRRENRGGVLVYTHVVETPIEQDVRLQEEKVDVSRRKVDRPATDADFREQTIEAQGFTEQPVVSKEARIVEEVVIAKKKGERTQKVRDKVRRTEVDVQELDKDYRQDFEKRFSGQGYTYDQSRAAYEYGRQLAEYPDYRDRDWSEVEPEARRLFEEKNPGLWDRFKDAIQHAFERARMRKAA